MLIMYVTMKLPFSPPEGLEKDKMEKTRTVPGQLRYLYYAT